MGGNHFPAVNNWTDILTGTEGEWGSVRSVHVIVFFFSLRGFISYTEDRWMFLSSSEMLNISLFVSFTWPFVRIWGSLQGCLAGYGYRTHNSNRWSADLPPAWLWRCRPSEHADPQSPPPWTCGPWLQQHRWILTPPATTQTDTWYLVSLWTCLGFEKGGLDFSPT